MMVATAFGGGENMLRFPDGTLRYMTVREAKLIQSFPPDFTVTGSWGEALRQIGNAVPVRLAEAVGRRLVETLQDVQDAHANEEVSIPQMPHGWLRVSHCRMRPMAQMSLMPRDVEIRRAR